VAPNVAGSNPVSHPKLPNVYAVIWRAAWPNAENCTPNVRKIACISRNPALPASGTRSQFTLALLHGRQTEKVLRRADGHGGRRCARHGSAAKRRHQMVEVLESESERMGFERQLAVFVTVAATVIAFVCCVMWLGISVKISLLISGCVLLGGLLFGRPFADVIIRIFS
jgi:hypothetical protein